MKIAKSSDGTQLVANATAPHQAVCPICGGTLTLRSRRTMDNGKRVYYWRHRGNHNPHCTARNRPFN
ncbi:MAG: hypothetical protein ACRDHL_14785 [Candidatus Promineifilaceae bacterium]